MTEDAPELEAWLDVVRGRLLDINDAGTVLAWCDQTGSAPLYLLDTRGTAPSTALPDPCFERFAGSSAVWVRYDHNGDARFRLALPALARTTPERAADPMPRIEQVLTRRRTLAALDVVGPR
ncbi:hypothetical protein ACWDSJ_28185 [Nocardia sp. NPDC003482]